MYKRINVIKSGGIEIRGMKANLAPRRQNTQTPNVERYTFKPFFNQQTEKSLQDLLAVMVQIVIENSQGALKLKVTEVADGQPPETLLTPLVMNIVESEPTLTVSVI